MGFTTMCPLTITAKGSELQNFSLNANATVHLLTKSLMVKKRKFYATNTLKRSLGWSPMIPYSFQEWVGYGVKQC